MKLSTFVLSSIVLCTTGVVSRPVKRDVDPNLVPPFGVQAGVNPTGTGDCDGIAGADGKPIKIPCACPPALDEFLQSLNANVNAGFVINNPTVGLSFPTDNSKNSQNARLHAAAVTLQNLHGPGKGCPIAATTFSAQQKVIDALPNTPAPVSTSAAAPKPTTTPVQAPAPAPTNNAGTGNTPTPQQIAALAPPLGFTSGKNPTGTGDCDGAVNGSDGKPIKIPCACPPAQDVYIQSLTANVLAGKAVNNPTVKVTFPLDNSKNSQSARLTAASITLQNLNGPGKGCPIVSTTFSAQQQAINAQSDNQASSPTPAQPVQASSSASSSKAAAPSPVTTGNAAGTPSADQITALAPPLGFKSGINPTGTGDCDGAVNGADGKPIKIPCACPPAQDVYIKSLIANVQAGHAINNTVVKVSFPLDNSKNSQSARLTAASITLQNLNGPGKGCPVVSTTFSAQQKAIDAQSNVAVPVVTSQAPAAPVASSTKAATLAPVPTNNAAANSPSADQIAALAPPLGFKSGVNPTGTGDCDGAVNGADGKPIKIPCACPPAQDVYIKSLVANIQAGFAVNNPSVKVSFPLDNSKNSQSARLTAASITLQNLNGPGKGCPIVSTTFSAQQKAINAQPDNQTPATTSPAKATTPAAAPAPTQAQGNANGKPSDAQVAALAPPLGFKSGLNPTGTGDCDGAVNGADGKPIKIPCACPPAQDVYIKQLQQNVAAGFAINNPTVKVSFPTDNSKASQSARITAALITLQNLNGPGKGCPAVSTTLLAQQKAL